MNDQSTNESRITATISSSEIERCVLCKDPTPYRRDDPIEKRMNYIEGCGQLCRRCAIDVY